MRTAVFFGSLAALSAANAQAAGPAMSVTADSHRHHKPSCTSTYTGRARLEVAGRSFQGDSITLVPGAGCGGVSRVEVRGGVSYRVGAQVVSGLDSAIYDLRTGTIHGEGPVGGGVTVRPVGTN